MEKEEGFVMGSKYKRRCEDKAVHACKDCKFRNEICMPKNEGGNCKEFELKDRNIPIERRCENCIHSYIHPSIPFLRTEGCFIEENEVDEFGNILKGQEKNINGDCKFFNKIEKIEEPNEKIKKENPTGFWIKVRRWLFY